MLDSMKSETKITWDSYTAAEATVLYELESVKRLALSDLQLRLEWTPKLLAEVLVALEDQGLVRMRRRRLVGGLSLSLTPDGRKRFAEYMACFRIPTRPIQRSSS